MEQMRFNMIKEILVEYMVGISVPEFIFHILEPENEDTIEEVNRLASMIGKFIGREASLNWAELYYLRLKQYYTEEEAKEEATKLYQLMSTLDQQIANSIFWSRVSENSSIKAIR